MPIPKRTLGRTGVEVTALGLGGVCWNLRDTDAEAIEVVHRAIDLGITYYDTAAGYKESERLLGLALQDRDRDGLFIATKYIKRSGDEFRAELEEGFSRLQVDVIDLVQLHAIDQDEDLKAVLGPDGALRVLEEYREAGKVRFVGLTGHTHPDRFVRAIQEYDFDIILNPHGAVNRAWNDFTGPIVPIARAKGMGVICMKAMAYGQVPPADVPLYLRYAMSQDVDVVIPGMDTVEHVEQNVAIAESFVPLSPDEEKEALDRALALIKSAGTKKLWWLPEERVAA